MHVGYADIIVHSSDMYTAQLEYMSQVGLYCSLQHMASCLFMVSAVCCKQTNYPTVCMAGIEIHEGLVV